MNFFGAVILRVEGSALLLGAQVSQPRPGVEQDSEGSRVADARLQCVGWKKKKGQVHLHTQQLQVSQLTSNVPGKN